MKIFQAYKKGFNFTICSPKLVFLVYTFTLLIALLVVIPFSFMLQNAIGNSMSVNSLLVDFDYTVYRDFLLHNDSIPDFLKSQILWFGIFYYFFSIFVAGGILHSIKEKEDKFSLADFLKGCSKYLTGFLRLSIIILFLYSSLTIFIYGLVLIIIGELMNSIRSETEILAVIGSALVVHVFFVLLISIISDYSKIILVKSDYRKAIISFGKAFVFSMKNIFSIYFLYVLIGITAIIFLIFYFFVDMKMEMTSSNTIILMAIFQQLFIGIRIFTKIWLLAGQFEFHNLYIKSEETVEEVMISEEIEEWNFEALKEPKIES